MNHLQSEIASKIRKATSRAERMLLLQQAAQPQEPKVAMAGMPKSMLSTYAYAAETHLRQAQESAKEFSAALKEFQAKVKTVQDIAKRAEEANRKIVQAQKAWSDAYQDANGEGMQDAELNGRKSYTEVTKDRTTLKNTMLTLPGQI